MLKDIKRLKEFVTAQSQSCMFTSEINAWVFVWYPEGTRYGHVAMMIGDIHAESAYVSWWPKKSRDGLPGFYKKSPASRVMIFNPVTHQHEFTSSDYFIDCYSEENTPHVVYGLRGLDVREMETAWRNIVSKGGASFSPLSKNCAVVVSRVLKAGLKHSQLRHKVFGMFDGDQFIWTPKRIAVICNLLRDNNSALKIKIPGRESKKTFIKTLVRLR